MDSDLMRWVKAQADDPNANPRFRELLAALEAAREDAERLSFLASEPVVEGFVGVEKDIYDYACDAAWESGRDEPSEADMLAGLRRMIDAAIDQARGRGVAE